MLLMKNIKNLHITWIKIKFNVWCFKLVISAIIETEYGNKFTTNYYTNIGIELTLSHSSSKYIFNNVTYQCHWVYIRISLIDWYNCIVILSIAIEFDIVKVNNQVYICIYFIFSLSVCYLKLKRCGYNNWVMFFIHLTTIFSLDLFNPLGNN